MSTTIHEEDIATLMTALDGCIETARAHARAKSAYCAIVAEFESKTDDNGKPLSSSKAQALADATPQADEYRMTKAELDIADKRLATLHIIAHLKMDKTALPSV